MLLDTKPYQEVKCKTRMGYL